MHIISDTNIGGAGNLLLNYLSAYDHTQFRQSVVLPRGAMLKRQIEALGIEVFEIATLRDKSLDLKAISELRHVILRRKPDIVHTHGAFSGRIAARRCGCKVVFTRHSAFPPSPRTTRGLGQRLFKWANERYADAIIAVSPVCADALFASGIREDIVHTVYNGVEPIPPKSDVIKNAVRGKYGINDYDFVVSMAARIEPYKGQMTLVEAAAELARRRLYPKIIIAGTGAQEAEVRKRAEELDVTMTVRFPGFVDDVPFLLAVSHVQVNASSVEASSLSLLEGMSIGVPAAASNTSGNPYVIKDGENGLLFEVGNAVALADVIERYMTDPELRANISERAKAIFSERFTIERAAADTEAVYKGLLTDKNSRNGKDTKNG